MSRNLLVQVGFERSDCQVCRGYLEGEGKIDQRPSRAMRVDRTIAGWTSWSSGCCRMWRRGWTVTNKPIVCGQHRHRTWNEILCWANRLGKLNHFRRTETAFTRIGWRTLAVMRNKENSVDLRDTRYLHLGIRVVNHSWVSSNRISMSVECELTLFLCLSSKAMSLDWAYGSMCSFHSVVLAVFPGLFVIRLNVIVR